MKKEGKKGEGRGRREKEEKEGEAGFRLFCHCIEFLQGKLIQRQIIREMLWSKYNYLWNQKD